MPSNLRLQASFDTQSTQSYFPTTSPASPPQKKQKMSLTQTYRIASTARSKLGREASRSDHDLRLLVGHANLLDSLMIELADAEREQEAWFNETLRKSNKPETPRHVQWIDTISEEDDEEEDSDSDSDSDIYDEDFQVEAPRRRSVSPPPATNYEYDDEEDFEDYEDNEGLALTRTKSHPSPPELVHEDSDSEDDSMPPSPPSQTLEFNSKSQQAINNKTFYPQVHEHEVHDDFMRNSGSQMISAY